MSESRLPCPICDRAPGDRHNHFCPRSSVQLRCRPEPGGPRRSYMSKGVDIIEHEGVPSVVTNPGFPFVRTEPRLRGLTRSQRHFQKRHRRTMGFDAYAARRKPFTAGGLPLGFDAESALEYAKEKAIRPLQRPTPTTEETPS